MSNKKGQMPMSTVRTDFDMSEKKKNVLFGSGFNAKCKDKRFAVRLHVYSASTIRH